MIARHKITKSRHKNVRLLNEENMMTEKLMKKAYNYSVWLRKQRKNLFIKLETLKNKKSVNTNQ